MKKLNLFFLFNFFSVALMQAVTTLNNHNSVAALSVVVIPIDAVSSTDTFTINIFATIDAIYGTAGIGMDKYQVSHLKKTYLYLIFLAKCAQVKKNPAYQQYKSTFGPFLTDNQTSLPNIPTAALLSSSACSAVTVTVQDLQNSVAWQHYVKTMICDIYVYFATVLGVIHNVEKQMFNYIPNFETSFYNADYTDLRTLNETARTRLVIEEALKHRWKSQVVAWAKLPSLGTAQAKTNTPKQTTPK